MRRYLFAAIVLTTVAGCGVNFPALFGWDTPETDVARLRQFQSEEELKAYLVSQNQNDFFGGPVFALGDEVDSFATDGGSSAPTAEPSPDGATGNGAESVDDGTDRNFSTTTEQEEGVQESDIIKNDGEYLYVLSRGVLRIVKATPPDAMVEVGSIDLEGYGVQMYLIGDQAVTITMRDSFRSFDGDTTTNGGDSGVRDDGGVSSNFSSFRPQAEIDVIDVTDRANPSIVSRATIDGTINTSRMIDKRLYLVAVNYPDIYAGPFMLAKRGKTIAFEDLPLSDLLPNIAIEVGDEVVYNGDIADFSDHFRPVDPDGLGLTSIVTFDIDAPQNYTAQTVVAYPANVYASTHAIYMTDTQYSSSGSIREATDIYKFSFTPTGVAQTAAGTVKGRVLDQYSMSEYEGFLRVATTISATFGMFDVGMLDNRSPSTNNVYVLEQSGEELTVAGSIEDLAPGESIFSARLIGPRGYLVTFKQIDPLFTLDLSDPRNPKKVGELKVPGFSTFIMPMGTDHLLTIGRNIDNEFGSSDSIRLSVFDISDFANPVLAHYEVIGELGASSEALYDPKAFTYFAEGGVLAFPIEIYGWDDRWGNDVRFALAEADVSTNGSDDAGSNGETDSDSNGSEDSGAPPDDYPIDIALPLPNDYFSGVYIYNVSAEDGFDVLGRISTRSEEQRYGDGSGFTRGVFIGDTVYAITSKSVQAADVADVNTILSTVTFPEPDFGIPEEPLPEPAPDMPGEEGGQAGEAGA